MLGTALVFVLIYAAALFFAGEVGRRRQVVQPLGRDDRILGERPLPPPVPEAVAPHPVPGGEPGRPRAGPFPAARHLLRVAPGEVNLGKLAALEHVSVEVAQGRLSPAAGTEAIERISAAPSPYGPALTTMTRYRIRPDGLDVLAVEKAGVQW